MAASLRMAGWALVKVALLSDCYLPRLGGIEVQVHDLAQQLQAAGHEVEVFTATMGPNGERAGTIENIAGIPVHRFALRLPYGIPVNPLAPKEVRSRLSQGNFSVAHVHMGVVSPFAVDMARVGLGLGLPTAITWHCVLDRSRPLMNAVGYARRWAREGAALSAVSAMAAQRVADITGGAQVRVLPNGISVREWAPDRSRVPRGTQRDQSRAIRINSALRLARRKRPGAIIDVIAQANADLKGRRALHVDVFGDGPQRPIMQARIDRLGLAEVIHLRGRVSRDDLRRAHHAADLYLSPATLEAFGIAALEARTAGLPVIAQHGTGIEDFVTDGVNGILSDEDTLAEAIVRLSLDDELRTSMAAVNATTAPSQAWSRVVESGLAEYRRAGVRGE